MTGDQLHRIFKFALVAAQRPFAKIVDHNDSADRDGRNQERATADQRANGPAGKKSLRVKEPLPSAVIANATTCECQPGPHAGAGLLQQWYGSEVSNRS